MNWMIRWAGPFPLFVESASGARFTDVDGHEYVDFCLGRHRRDGRPRARADDRRGRAPAAPRDHPHAADRGRDRRRRRAAPAVRAPVLAVHAHGDGRQPVRDPARPPRDRPARRSSSTTTTTTARSTRRSPGSGPTAASSPGAATSAPRSPPSETTRVVEINDLDALERELAHGDVAVALMEPALTNVGIVLPGSRLPRGRPRADPAARDAADHRRDPHDLRRAGRLHGGARARAGHPHDRQDHRRRDPRGGLRVHRGAGRADRREHPGGGRGRRRRRRHAGRATRCRWRRSGRP